MAHASGSLRVAPRCARGDEQGVLGSVCDACFAVIALLGTDADDTLGSIRGAAVPSWVVRNSGQLGSNGLGGAMSQRAVGGVAQLTIEVTVNT